MSLENLLKTKQLQPHNPTREAVQRLLQAAMRNIADAHVENISGENRFDAGYERDLVAHGDLFSKISNLERS